jgi:hypothetical protein
MAKPEFTDEDMLNWLGQDANRLEDVRGWLNNEEGSIRDALTALMSAHIPRRSTSAAHSEAVVVEPHRSVSSWRTVYDLLGGSLILRAEPFSVELGVDGAWRGENAEVVQAALGRGGLTWPRCLTLRLSQGRLAIDTADMPGEKNVTTARARAAQQALKQGVLFPNCRLATGGAKPGAKLAGLHLFEIQ